MDLGRGLTFATHDAEWLKKVAIGTLISFVPILNFAATGYSMDVLRNVSQGRETPLPEWNNLGEQFVRGLLGTIVQFLWSMPIMILGCPLFFIATLTAAQTSNGDEPGALAGVAFGCVGLLMALGALALAPFTMAAYTRYAITNQFSEALPGPVLREVRSSFRPWLLILLAAIAFGIVAALLAVCTFGVGYLLLFPLIFYMQLVTAHWFAQAHRESTGGLAAPPSMV